MQDFGFSSTCSFPNTGVNCTEFYVRKVSPAIRYTTVIGAITYVLLTIPTLALTHVKWTQYRDARSIAGPGLRFVCALANSIAGLFTITLFATGHMITYPVNELLGVLSFLAAYGTNLGYCVVNCCVILMARRIFFHTILHQAPTERKIKALHKVNEIHIIAILLAPPVIVYSTSTILLLNGLIEDNIVLWRINMGGLAVYVVDLLILTRVYGWPVVNALNKLCASALTSRDDAKIFDLSQKLTAQLKFLQLICALFILIFILISVTNVLSIPEVGYGICVYSFNVIFPLQHISNVNFLKKPEDNIFVKAFRLTHSTRKRSAMTGNNQIAPIAKTQDQIPNSGISRNVVQTSVDTES